MQDKFINLFFILLFIVTMNASYIILGAHFLLAAGFEHPIGIALILGTVAACVAVLVTVFICTTPERRC